MNSNIERREGTFGARPTAEPGADGTAERHQSGEWPVGCRRQRDAEPLPDGDLQMSLAAWRARREVFLGAVRADLEEQPSPRAVRAAGRRWCRQITAMAEDVATAKVKEATK